MRTVVAPTSLDDHGGGWLPSLTFSAVFVVICGLVYPAVATLISGVLFPTQAKGSLVEHDGHVVGSSLVAQPFADVRYFQARPSAAGFDPKAASGSNLASSNPALRERIAKDSAAIVQREAVDATRIPSDLVTASGSGLDPHISPAAAAVQIDRVAKARGLSMDQVGSAVAAATEAPLWGILGKPRVNVLRLNVSLDERQEAQQ
ncbi:MAG: potassium-transporting ATPase subunit KdpC [Tahibacter sp.]